MSNFFTRKEIFYLMKITLTPLLFVCLLTTLSFAENTFGQERLQEKITLYLKNTELKTVLKTIEQKANVVFSYQKGVLTTNEKLSLDIKDETLESVLQQILTPRQINFQVLKANKIVLTRRFLGNVQEESKSKPILSPLDLKLDQTVTGKVSDEKGDGLPGVSILVKGTQRGTSTNATGDFSIAVPDRSDGPEKAVLVFSYVGYEPQEIVVGNRTSINLTMKVDNKSLEEVVVVGYGTQKKVNVIGSVSQISSKDIDNRPVTQVSQAITGQMPGVTVIQSTGRPGQSGGQIRVRGVGSFGATPDALVLIDGIAGTMNDINPNDIKTISVLKDASSAAIYGARSANGVILITTKNGTSDKLSVGYDGYVGFNDATAFPDFVNSADYATMFNIASGSQSFSPATIEKYRNQSDPDNFPNTRFLDEVFSRSGLQTAHTITLNGGNDKNRFYLSGGFLNQEGIVAKNSFTRYNQRLTIQNKLSNKIELNTRIFGALETRKEPQATANKGGGFLDQLIQNAIRYPSIFVGQASNGDYGVGPESGGTPVSWLASDSYLRNPNSRFGINSKLDWKPINGLTLSAIGGYNFSLFEQRSYLASQRLNANVFQSQAYLNQSSNKVIFKTMQYTGEYAKEINKHSFSLLAGYSFEEQNESYFNGYRQDFPSNDYTVLDMGGFTNQLVGGYDDAWAIQSLFSRAKYSFNERYLFEATVRRDGSSRFPAGNKYATFPSAAVGWRISEESFMKPLTWITDMKLKASWGVLGNQNIGNYPYQQVLNSGRNYPFGNTVSTGAAYALYRDPNIKWESTETYDLGLESSFFNGALNLNVTYFNRNTKDILFRPSSSVSTVLGVGISETNTGAVENTGWEFDLGYQGRKGKWKYSFNGNFSIINNKVLTLGLGNVNQPNGYVGNGSDLFIGFPMQMYYGFLSDGVFLNSSDIAEWPVQTAVTPRPQPGDIRYKDISGPNGVPDGKVDPIYDRTYLGSRIPKYTFGANVGLSYSNFDLSMFMQGVAGVKGTLTGYAGYAFFNLGNIQKWQMDGRFNPDQPTRYPAYPRLEEVTNSGTPNTVTSDFWVINAAYLRVKNIQLAYNVPKNILNKMRLNNLKLYVTGENMFSFNNFRQGWDPEINTGGDYYPILRTYTFGINLKF